MALSNLSDENLSARVVDQLRQAILSGDLAPGERLVERKLADQLGVSHIPVRESLTILTEEHLVERRPRRGARVAVLSETDLDEISSLRVVLEQFVAVRVQERWNPDTEQRLRTIVAQMVNAAEKAEDVSRVFGFDRDFHQALWDMSEHSLLVELTARLRGRINGFLLAAVSALEPEQLKKHAESHLKIIDALAAGDPELAQAVVAEHIEVAAERITTVGATPGEDT